MCVAAHLSEVYESGFPDGRTLRRNSWNMRRLIASHSPNLGLLPGSYCKRAVKTTCFARRDKEIYNSGSSLRVPPSPNSGFITQVIFFPLANYRTSPDRTCREGERFQNTGQGDFAQKPSGFWGGFRKRGVS